MKKAEENIADKYQDKEQFEDLHCECACECECEECKWKKKNKDKEEEKKKKKKEKKKDGDEDGDKPIPYPFDDQSTSRTFQIKYKKKLSLIAKSMLNSFQFKYLYYAIDDILYLLKTNVSEQKDMLALLYSPVISLQNNFYVNFFEIWIEELYIEEISHINKFLKNDFQTSEPTSYITITLRYRISRLPKKTELFW